MIYYTKNNVDFRPCNAKDYQRHAYDGCLIQDAIKRANTERRNEMMNALRAQLSHALADPVVVNYNIVNALKIITELLDKDGG